MKKKIYILLSALLMSSALWAESVTVGVYADGCTEYNQYLCVSGQEIEVEAAAIAGTHFTQWNDGNTDNPRTITVTSDITLTAFYASDVYTVSVFADGCSEYNQYLCTYGQEIEIEAQAISGYHFTRWSDGNTDNPRIVVVDRDTTYTAEFDSDVLALDDTQDNTAALTAKLGQDVDVTLVGRTLLGGMWNTLCLPFDVPALAGTPLENCQIVSYVDATGNGIDGIDMQFEYVTALSAGTPYLVKPVADIVEPTFEGVTISAIDGLTLSGSGNVDFVGVLKPVNLLAEATAPYIMGLNNMIYVPAAGMFKAYRAYFDIVNPALHNAPLRVVVHDQTTTSVQATTAIAPKTTKQLIDGQLLIRRDGKTYNAQGIEL